MIALELVNVRIGSSAKGSWRLMSTFRRSLNPVSCSIPVYKARRIVGNMAMERVRSTRCQRFHCRFRNPCER